MIDPNGKMLKYFFFYQTSLRLCQRLHITIEKGYKTICTNLTSNEIFSLAIVVILTADVYTENLL